MKLRQEKVEALAEQVVDMLQERAEVELEADPGRARVLVRQAMLEELLVEDRLEEEVRDILKQYEYEIRRGRMSYNTLFDRIKRKLVRERDLVL